MKNKKLLIKSIVYAVVAFFMMAASVFAWFVYRNTEGSVIIDSDERRKCDATLYEFKYTATDYNSNDAITFDYVISADAETGGSKGKFVDITDNSDVLPGGHMLMPGFDRYFRLDLKLEQGTFADAMIYLANIVLRDPDKEDDYKDFIMLNVLDDSDADNPVVNSVRLFDGGVIDSDNSMFDNLAVLKTDYRLAKNIQYSVYFSVGLDMTATIDVEYDEDHVFSVKYVYIRY